MKLAKSSNSAVKTSPEPASNLNFIPVPVPAFDGAMMQLLSNEENSAKEAVVLLLKIISNIIKNPMEEKYRKVKNSNAAFQKKIISLHGGVVCISVLGFQLIGDEWVLIPTSDAWNTLLACQAKLDKFMARYLEVQSSGSCLDSVAPVSANVSSKAEEVPMTVVDEDAIFAMQQLLLSAALLHQKTEDSNQPENGATLQLDKSGSGGDI